MIDPPSTEFFARIAVALERIATALERGASPHRSLSSDPRAEAVAELRHLIRDGKLAQAEILLGDFQIDHPDAPEAPALIVELAKKAQTAVENLHNQLAAARKSNSPEAALELRDELAPLLNSVERETVDRDLLTWLMSNLMRRLRTGTVRADVAILAARIANSFPHRPEGASLKASLPTLRRSAGLCARCAEPYSGEEDACPKCLPGIPKIAELTETPDLPT